MPKGVGYSGNRRAPLAPQSGIQELNRKAVTNGKLTKSQGTTLLRHRKHHSEGHMMQMLSLMIENICLSKTPMNAP